MARAKLHRKWKDVLCERISEGRSLRSVSSDEDMPSVTYVMRLLKEDEEFVEQYARAMDMRADALFDEMFEIADTCIEGQKVKKTSDGKKEVTTGDMVERSKLRVDVRKWALARMSPKKYGDRLKVDADIAQPLLNDQDQLERLRINLPVLIPMLNELGYDVTPRET